MTKPNADFYRLGDWNAACFRCGRKFKASMLQKTWQGYWVCKDDWQPRHPQDFVKNEPDVQTPPWSQPQTDEFLAFCGINSRSSVSGFSVGGCWVTGLVVT